MSRYNYEKECDLMEVQDYVMYVMSVCYVISTKTKADCFFEYSPHVSSVKVQLWADGWKRGELPGYDMDALIYIDDKDAMKKLEDLRITLQEFLYAKLDDERNEVKDESEANENGKS